MVAISIKALRKFAQTITIRYINLHTALNTLKQAVDMATVALGNEVYVPYSRSEPAMTFSEASLQANSCKP